MKHTAGPWVAGTDGNLRVYGPDNAGEDSGLIAHVFKGRANVRLIAAAPVMIDALYEAETALLNYAADLRQMGDEFKLPLCNLALERIRAAIKQATGEVHP